MSLPGFGIQTEINIRNSTLYLMFARSKVDYRTKDFSAPFSSLAPLTTLYREAMAESCWGHCYWLNFAVVVGFSSHRILGFQIFGRPSGNVAQRSVLLESETKLADSSITVFYWDLGSRVTHLPKINTTIPSSSASLE